MVVSKSQKKKSQKKRGKSQKKKSHKKSQKKTNPCFPPKGKENDYEKYINSKACIKDQIRDNPWMLETDGDKLVGDGLLYKEIQKKKKSKKSKKKKSGGKKKGVLSAFMNVVPSSHINNFKRDGKKHYGIKNNKVIELYPHKIKKSIGRHKYIILWKTTKENLPGKTFHGKFYKSKKEAMKKIKKGGGGKSWDEVQAFICQVPELQLAPQMESSAAVPREKIQSLKTKYETKKSSGKKVSPEVQALKTEFKQLIGRDPKGPKANDVEWLKLMTNNYTISGGGDREDMKKMYANMSEEKLIKLISTMDIGEATLTPIESKPESEPEYPFPERLDGNAMSFFPEEVYNKIYDRFVNLDKYPNELTCLEVKNLCKLDPEYCKINKFKERYHKLCKEIKITNLMIDEYFETETKNEDFKELYEIEEYITEVNINKKLKLDKDVIEMFISIFKDKDFIKEEYDYDKYDMTWFDFENIITPDILKDMMYEFGKKLYNINPDRYYPIIIEIIKHKILKEYFM